MATTRNLRHYLPLLSELNERAQCFDSEKARALRRFLFDKWCLYEFGLFQEAPRRWQEATEAIASWPELTLLRWISWWNCTQQNMKERKERRSKINKVHQSGNSDCNNTQVKHLGTQSDRKTINYFGFSLSSPIINNFEVEHGSEINKFGGLCVQNHLFLVQKDKINDIMLAHFVK